MNVLLSYLGFVFVPFVVFGVPPMWLEGVIFGIMLLGFRQIFMVIPLNLMRKRPALYLGTTSKFDKIAKKFGWLVFLVAGLIIVGGMSYFYFFLQFFSVV